MEAHWGDHHVGQEVRVVHDDLVVEDHGVQEVGLLEEVLADLGDLPVLLVEEVLHLVEVQEQAVVLNQLAVPLKPLHLAFCSLYSSFIGKKNPNTKQKLKLSCPSVCRPLCSN